MKHFIWQLICLLFLSYISIAQSFKGTVLDSTSNESLPGVNIYIPELQTGTATDMNGNFEIKKTISGLVHLQASFIGYESFVTLINLERSGPIVIRLSKSHLNLNEIVVSTSGVQLQKDNITAVTKASIEELSLSASNLADGLSKIPGVNSYSTGQGIGKPVIRGLSGSRIIIYDQNVRMENQQWGDEHAIGISETGIDNVEVIKGPSSLLYGADALGGVIYFTDSRYAMYNSTEGFASSKFNTNSMGLKNDGGIKINRNGVKFNLFGGHESNADYQLPNSKRANNSRFSNSYIRTALGLNSSKWIGNIRYSYIKSKYGITESDIPTTTTNYDPELPFQDVVNHLLSIDQKYFIGQTQLAAIIAYNGNGREEYEDDMSIPSLKMQLNTYSYNLKSKTNFLNEKLIMNTGVQGMFQENKNKADEILIPDANTQDIGFFGVLNYKYSHAITLEGGVRFDNRTISTKKMVSDEVNFESLNRQFQNFNYSAGLSIDKKPILIRFNTSTGFRSPNTAELLSDGVHEGTQRYEIGNRNLKSEEAFQVDLGLYYNKEHFDLSINPFVNRVNNYIYLEPTGSFVDGAPLYLYQQKQAWLYGGEFGFHWHPHPVDWLHISSDLSLVFAEDKDGNALPLIPQHKLNNTFSAELNRGKKIKFQKFYTELTYHFKQTRVETFESPSNGYMLLNVGVTGLVVTGKNSNLGFSIEVANLLNETYIDHLSRLRELGLAGPGIGFTTRLKWSFGKI